MVTVYYQWNTYGDPPNSDLLWWYGHIDIVCLPQSSVNGPSDTELLWASIRKGNPADIGEAKAILVADAFSTLEPNKSKHRSWPRRRLIGGLSKVATSKCYSVVALSQ